MDISVVVIKSFRDYERKHIWRCVWSFSDKETHTKKNPCKSLSDRYAIENIFSRIHSFFILFLYWRKIQCDSWKISVHCYRKEFLWGNMYDLIGKHIVVYALLFFIIFLYWRNICEIHERYLTVLSTAVERKICVVR